MDVRGMLSDLHGANVLGYVDDGEPASSFVHGLHECLAFFCCHFLPAIGVVQEIKGCQIGDVVFRAVIFYVSQIAAAQNVLIVPAIDHACAFALSQCALQQEIFFHGCSLGSESFLFQFGQIAEAVVDEMFCFVVFGEFVINHIQ